MSYREFKDDRANSIDPDEVAHKEPPHLYLRCLQIQLLSFLVFCFTMTSCCHPISDQRENIMLTVFAQLASGYLDCQVIGCKYWGRLHKQIVKNLIRLFLGCSAESGQGLLCLPFYWQFYIHLGLKRIFGVFMGIGTGVLAFRVIDKHTDFCIKGHCLG